MVALPFIVRLSRLNLSEARAELFYTYLGHVSVQGMGCRIANLTSFITERRSTLQTGAPGFVGPALANKADFVFTKVTPSYCKPGFAVVPTSLSNEQLRICYVMPPLRTAAAPAVSQPAPSPSQPARATVSQTTPVKLAFRDCLISNGKTGDYTSKDGGKSMLSLMGIACKSEWHAWQQECIAEGGTDGGPNGCTMQAGILAQSTLLLLGK